MTSHTRMLLATLDHTAGDKNVALVLADALDDQLSDRRAALRIVAAMRAFSVRRAAVPRAVSLLSRQSDTWRDLRWSIDWQAGADTSGLVPLVLVPGRERPRVVSGSLPERMPYGAVAILPVVDQPRRRRGESGPGMHIVVGAVWVIDMARLIGIGERPRKAQARGRTRPLSSGK